MIKISTNISKKVPIPGTEFSSQQFGASMEIEVSDADTPENIQVRIRDLYSLVTQAVDEQISAATGNNGNGGQPPPVRRTNYGPPAPPQNRQTAQAGSGYSGKRIARAGGNGGNGGNGHRSGATEAQCRAIFAICKSLNLDMNAELANYNVTDASQLHVKDASRLIDDLKHRQAAGNPEPHY